MKRKKIVYLISILTMAIFIIVIASSLITPISRFKIDKSGMYFKGESNLEEWWFGVFYDKSLDLGGLFDFHIHPGTEKNRLSVLFVGIGNLNTSGFKFFSLEDCEISKEKAYINTSSDLFELINESYGRVRLSNVNGNINLTFRKIIEGFIFEEKNVHIDVPMMWAKVEGCVEDGYKKYELNGFGYLEHIYGQGRKAGWNWGVISTNGIGILFFEGVVDERILGGAIIADQNKIIRFIPLRNLKIEFSKNDESVHIYSKDIGIKVDIYGKKVDEMIMNYTGTIIIRNKIFPFEGKIGFFQRTNPKYLELVKDKA